MKKFILIFFLSFMVFYSYGDLVSIDGIKYYVPLDFGGGETGCQVGEVESNETIVIPETIFYNGEYYPVRMIYYGAFTNKRVRNIEIHAKLLDMELDLSGTGVENITFSEDADIKYLMPFTLANCESLERLIFPKNASLKIIPLNFAENCLNLKEVVFPSGVEIIDNKAFTNTGLECVKLPDRLVSLGFDCFRNCPNLTDVILPSGLKEIGEGAFNENPGLRRIICLSFTPPKVKLGSDPYNHWLIDLPFGGGEYHGLELYVPEFVQNEYRENEFWGTFYVVNSWEDDWKSNYWYISNSEELPNYFWDIYCDQEEKLSIVLGPESRIQELPVVVNDLLLQHDFTKDEFRYAQLLNPNAYRDQQQETTVSTSFKIVPERWYFVSLPFDVNVDDIHLKTIWHNGDYGEDSADVSDDPRGKGYPFDFVVRYYDGETRALENTTGYSWKDVEPGEIIKAGSGIIIQAGIADTNWHQGIWDLDLEMIFPGTGDLSETFFADPWETREIELADNYNSSTYPENRGWNYIANPFTSYFDMNFSFLRRKWSDNNFNDNRFDNIITVYDPKELTYKVYSPDDKNIILPPLQSFFIQTESSDSYRCSLCFESQGKVFYNTTDHYSFDHDRLNAPLNNERTIFNLKLSDNNHSDATRIVFNPKASMDYEINKDATKFFSENAGVPQIYTIINRNTKLSINEQPQGTVKIGFYAPEAGEMILTFPRVDGKAVIHDATTGEDVVMAERDEYRFHAEKSGYDEDRFTLTTVQTADIVTSGLIEKSEPEIIIDKGRLIIKDASGEQITVMSVDGTILFNKSVHSDFEEYLLAPGFYCLTLGNKSVKCFVK